VEPAKDFMRLILDLVSSAVLVMWVAKVYIVSNVTPNSLGVFSRGTSLPYISTWGWILYSLVSGVKRVAVDLVGETSSSLSSRKERT
jgi:hypothetical protein